MKIFGKYNEGNDVEGMFYCPCDTKYNFKRINKRPALIKCKCGRILDGDELLTENEL